MLNEMYDFCEKCGWLFYGYKCSIHGTKNTRIGKLPKEEEEKPCSTVDTAEQN